MHDQYRPSPTWPASLVLLAALAGCAGPPAKPNLNASAPCFDGRLAYQYSLEATAFGPRPPGSAAHARLLAWLEDELAGITHPNPGTVPAERGVAGARKSSWQAQKFTAHTPDGPIPMINLIARFSGKSPGVIVIGGHYDTLSHRPGFVGANDGGSSTGILLALAKHFKAHPPTGPSVWIVWFDGEEAIGDWTGKDHTYGSRELVRRWRADDTTKRIRALLVLDMIGDRNLTAARQTNATPWLMNLVCNEAVKIGAGRNFCQYDQTIYDDDKPFRAAGVPAADLIDFRYGPYNEYWHTKEDTPDKLASASFRIVGSVVLATVRALSLRRGNQKK